ncbi:MAG TPA: tRNA uridine-5-carboxymethylaminomethyl(34) synthesis GTPase MnmE [Thermoanaerobaculia bacterium]|nr:tRNA uridine-5-carboxymethylaminomethyl(34) synthesis GTPase MnmE [Thermoanaerobaculia bacterium]
MSQEGFDTIVAAATAAARSALAIIRIDGPRSSEILRRLVLKAEDLEERRATLLRLEDDGAPLDEVIAIRFAAPRSYTGNEMVELTLHGNPLLVERVIDAIVRGGARVALPGEFSERAVLNGKLDLVQAESVADLINSRTRLQSRVSLDNLAGVLSREVRGVRESLLFVISRLEGALDFSGEGYEFINRDEASSSLQGAIGRVKNLIATHERGRATTEGLSAVILGRPNAGKSSLLNYLCGSDRAIVTDIAGTTRDLLRETVEIGGLPVTFIDTAGLREATDQVEKIGVARAREIAERADIVLYLVDSTAGVLADDEAEMARLPDPLLILTKADLVPTGPGVGLTVSLITGEGVPELLRLLDHRVKQGFAADESTPTLVNSRQRAAADESLAALQRAMASVKEGLAEEIVLVDLYAASRALGQLTGAISPADARREIFAKFCVGK